VSCLWSAQIEIEVIDINDCTPMFDYVPENPIYVDENTKSGIIGHVHATDDDSGNYQSVQLLPCCWMGGGDCLHVPFVVIEAQLQSVS